MSRMIVLGVLLLFAACGVPQEKHDADLANLKSEHAAELKASQAKAQAAWKKQSDKLKGTTEELQRHKERGDKLDEQLAASKAALTKCTEAASSAKSGKGKKKRRRKKR